LNYPLFVDAGLSSNWRVIVNVNLNMPVKILD
jgi:hypothetical protein